MASAVIEKAIIQAREAFGRNVTRPAEFRASQLKKLGACLTDNYDRFIAALQSDFRKPKLETAITELEFVKNDIQFQLDHLSEYVRPVRVAKGFANLFDDCYVKHDPYGVVLILGAWNYPVQVLLCPLVGAIAAGNCAVIKPSEVAPATEKLIAETLPKYLDSSCYPVITGGVETAQKLLQEKFDLIFFTGSPSIGKLVYQAAAKHMTPCVLELGGKSPVWIDESVSGGNLETAVKRILWGKTINAGQTCVAPDYVLCTEESQDKFVQVARNVIEKFYGADGGPEKSASFARIINERNFTRLEGLLSKTSGNVAIGGKTNKDDSYIAPTVVASVKGSDSLMSEELFGPILPIVTVQSEDEAIDFINRGEKPLSMYLFSNKQNVVDKFLDRTSSGSVCVNDTLMQMAVHNLPFGGVGNSGIGRYHGRYSFETFSHPKSVLAKDYNPIVEKLASVRYPPYTDGSIRQLKMLIAKSPIDGLNFGKLAQLGAAFAVGLATMYALSFR